MEIMSFVNMFIFISGLVSCFGGIFVRKLVSGLSGLFWGTVLSATVQILMLGIEVDEGALIFSSLAVGLLCGILAFIFDTFGLFLIAFFCAASFTSSLLASTEAFDSDETMRLIVSVLVGLLVALIAVKVYDVLYIIFTGFSGAFVVCTSVFMYIEDCSIEKILWSIVSGDMDLVLVGTFILGALGTMVQFCLFEKYKNRNKNKKEKAPAVRNTNPYQNQNQNQTPNPYISRRNTAYNNYRNPAVASGYQYNPQRVYRNVQPNQGRNTYVRPVVNGQNAVYRQQLYNNNSYTLSR